MMWTETTMALGKEWQSLWYVVIGFEESVSVFKE